MLSGGMVYQAIQTSPDEAQFLDSRRFSIYEVARILNIPVTKLRDNERSTYNNLLEESIDFVRESITPWARRIEQALNLSILGEYRGRRYEAQFQLDHLLARDQLARYQAYDIARDKWITDEEIRKWEGLGDMPQELIEKKKQEQEMAQASLKNEQNGGNGNDE